jgi:hypothetical protein
MPTKKIVIVALTSLLVGLLLGLGLGSRPVYEVRSGNVGCIGIKTTEFDPETATYRLEIANVYGQRPCLPEDSR